MLRGKAKPRVMQSSRGHKQWRGLYPNCLTWPVERTQVSGCHISTALWPPEQPSELGKDPQVGDPDAWDDIKIWTAYFYISSIFPASGSQGSDSDSVLTIHNGWRRVKGEPIPPLQACATWDTIIKGSCHMEQQWPRDTMKALCVCVHDFELYSLGHEEKIAGALKQCLV